MNYTIMDYVHWRGEQDIKEYPYNEIDYLIFSELAYVHLDDIFSSQNIQPITLFDAYQKYSELYTDAPEPAFNESHYLFKEVAKAKRYRNVKILHFYNDVNKDFIKQFCAMAFLFEDQRVFVAYRGTDNTLIGWHEDFLMLFENVIPSQTSSVHYLNFISEYTYSCSLWQSLHNQYLGSFKERFKKHFKYKKEGLPLLIGGHSKGGNLAMYSGCFTNEKVQARIDKIYNFDGPGFQDDIILSKQYQHMLPRIISYLPHYSFFGIVLGHEEQYQTIQSQATGMFQHNAFTWLLNKDGFIPDELSYESVQFAIKVLLFLNDLSYENKKECINTMFGLFQALELETFTDLSHITYKQIISGLKEITSLQPSVRKMLIDVLHMIWLEAKKEKMPS